METKIKKWGNSLGLRLPMNVVKELNISEGSTVELVHKNGKIIIYAKDSNLSLSQLILGMSKNELLDQFFEYPSMANEEEI